MQQLSYAARILWIVSILFCFSMAAQGGGYCSGDGQILLSSGQCVNGYYGYPYSNCNAVGANALVVNVPSGRLTCVAGPVCPSGYSQSMPPPQGVPYQVSPSMCQAICTPVFVNNNWPCSCPFGQHVDANTKSCAPICGNSGAMWMHSPGYSSKQISANYLVGDNGQCLCPGGQDYLSGPKACVPPCPPGKSRDVTGACTATNGGGFGGVPKYCSNGQHVGACTCPPSGQVKNGICILCALNGSMGSSPQCQSSGCPPGMMMDPEIHVCVPIPPPQKCPQGTQYQNGICVTIPPPGCPSGMVPTAGGGCALPPGPKCQPGFIQQGAYCVPEHKCPYMHHWDGKACVLNVVKCGPNAHLDSGGLACIPNNSGPRTQF